MTEQEQKEFALKNWRSFVNRINARAAKGKWINTYSLELLLEWERRALELVRQPATNQPQPQMETQ